MDIWNQLLQGFATAGTPVNLLWAFVGCALGSDGFQVLQKEFVVRHNPTDNTYTLRKHTIGRPR